MATTDNSSLIKIQTVILSDWSMNCWAISLHPSVLASAGKLASEYQPRLGVWAYAPAGVAWVMYAVEMIPVDLPDDQVDH